MRSSGPVRWVQLLYSLYLIFRLYCEDNCNYYMFYNLSLIQIVVSDKMDWIVLEEIKVSSPFQIFLLPNKMAIRISTQNKELEIDFS